MSGSPHLTPAPQAGGSSPAPRPAGDATPPETESAVVAPTANPDAGSVLGPGLSLVSVDGDEGPAGFCTPDGVCH